jgi:hypothetical protein
MTQYGALLLTLAFELTALFFWWRFADRGQSPWRYVMGGVAASCLTHPFAWWANETIGHALSRWVRLGIVELSVIGCEALIYFYVLPLSLKRGFALSLLANTFSFSAGLLVFMWLRA